jgi:hypothetical protein
MQIDVFRMCVLFHVAFKYSLSMLFIVARTIASARRSNSTSPPPG